MAFAKLLSPELRVPRDFFLLCLLSLLAGSGYVSVTYQEPYLFALPKALVFYSFMFCFSLMLIPEQWQLGIPAITLSIGLVIWIARRFDKRWRGFGYWLVLMGWGILVIFGFDIKAPIA